VAGGAGGASNVWDGTSNVIVAYGGRGGTGGNSGNGGVGGGMAGPTTAPTQGAGAANGGNGTFFGGGGGVSSFTNVIGGSSVWGGGGGGGQGFAVVLRFSAERVERVADPQVEPVRQVLSQVEAAVVVSVTAQRAAREAREL
jgi:hypothetical protein